MQGVVDQLIQRDQPAKEGECAYVVWLVWLIIDVPEVSVRVSLPFAVGFFRVRLLPVRRHELHVRPRLVDEVAKTGNPKPTRRNVLVFGRLEDRREPAFLAQRLDKLSQQGE